MSHKTVPNVVFALAMCCASASAMQNRMSSNVIVRLQSSIKQYSLMAQAEKTDGEAAGNTGIKTLELLKKSTVASLARPVISSAVVDRAADGSYTVWVWWISDTPNCDAIQIRMPAGLASITIPLTDMDRRAIKADAMNSVVHAVSNRIDPKIETNLDVQVMELLFSSGAIELSLLLGGQTIATTLDVTRRP